jgi:hypothetical protein
MALNVSLLKSFSRGPVADFIPLALAVQPPLIANASLSQPHNIIEKYDGVLHPRAATPAEP